MILLLNYADHSVEEQFEMRQWFRDNGLSFSTLVGPCWVDPVTRTLTVNRLVAVPGQENQDFPEFLTDDDAKPVTELEVTELLVLPLRWMLDMRGLDRLAG